MDEWEERVKAFWSTANDEDSEATLRGITELVAERPDGDSAAKYELASAYDFLGLEGEAIPLYREAVIAGLDEEREAFAIVQLASSLRNIGEPGEAVELLEKMPDHASIGVARDAFLALALFADGRSGHALKIALTALLPSLPQYARAIEFYAGELPEK